MAKKVKTFWELQKARGTEPIALAAAYDRALSDLVSDFPIVRSFLLGDYDSKEPVGGGTLLLFCDHSQPKCRVSDRSTGRQYFESFDTIGALWANLEHSLANGADWKADPWKNKKSGK